MAKKRKTLPDDMFEIVKSGDMQRFAAVFDKCEIGAHKRGKTESNILTFDITLEQLRFVVENGIDLNADSGWGHSSVYHLANDIEQLKYILEHGADIENNINIGTYSRGTALFACAEGHRAQAVENLLACGADPEPRGGYDDETALDISLHRCRPADTVNTLRIAKALLAAGAKTSDRTGDYVKKIGEDFEFYRDSFNAEYVDECSAALDELYRLFDVEPVPRRVIYDGKSRIEVGGETWQEQYSALWKLLVPGSGHANTVQGEVIRICGRVSYELIDNGGVNWDGDYRKMLAAMPKYFHSANGADSGLVEEACSIAGRISSNSGEEQTYRLTELAVKWVLANPDPIPLESVDYRR